MSLWPLAIFVGTVAIAELYVAVQLRRRMRYDGADVQRSRLESRRFIGAARAFAVAARESPDNVLTRLSVELAAVSGDAQNVAVFNVDDTSVECVFVAGDRFADYVGVKIERANAQKLIAIAAATQETAVLGDEGEALHPSDRSAIAIPFAAEPSIRWVLYVSHARGLRWTQSEIEQLEAMAEQAAPAYLLALERQRDRKAAVIDQLSGCVNKNAFLLRFEEELARVRGRGNARVSLLFIDADHFKSWNDTYGHSSGDRLISRLGRVIREHAPSGMDIVARYGGDEFCMVL